MSGVTSCTPQSKALALFTQLQYSKSYYGLMHSSIAHNNYYVGMTQKQRRQLQSMYQRLHSNFITRKHLVASNSTGSSLYMLPQYTVALRVSRNYSKVTDLKLVKIQNCSSFFLSSQPSSVAREMTQLKQPSIVRNFSGMVLLCLVRNKTIVYVKCAIFQRPLLNLCYYDLLIIRTQAINNKHAPQEIFDIPDLIKKNRNKST